MNKITIAALLGLAIIPFAQAVSLSPDGRGQALIYPYYTAQGNNDTLFSIVNPTSDLLATKVDQGKALKVRFYEGRNGRVVLDFNLYLAENTTWTAAVTRDANGNPILRTFDSACTAPRFGAGSIAGSTEIAFSNANYAGYDQAGSGLDRAREGHFEVIEMGRINDTFPIAAGVPFYDHTGNNIPPKAIDCAALAASWTAGGAFSNSGGAELLAPSGGLFGHAFIINVPLGTEYSYDPDALQGLFSVQMHTPPGGTGSSLAQAAPVSRVLVDGVYRESTWSRGIDAVSAVLVHRAAMNEFVSPVSNLPLGTDLILTFPTRSYYVVRDSDVGQSTKAPFTVKFSDLKLDGTKISDGSSPGACEPTAAYRVGRNGNGYLPYRYPVSFNPDPYFMYPDATTLCWQTNVLSYGNVLRSANAQSFAQDANYPSSGRAEVFLDQSGHVLTSLEGHQYVGLPVVGFAMQHRLNGNVGGMIANYSGTSLNKYETVLK
jgi:hypothetical protein